MVVVKCKFSLDLKLNTETWSMILLRTEFCGPSFIKQIQTTVCVVLNEGASPCVLSDPQNSSRELFLGQVPTTKLN